MSLSPPPFLSPSSSSSPPLLLLLLIFSSPLLTPSLFLLSPFSVVEGKRVEMFMARVAPGSVLGQNSYLTHSFVARRRTSLLLSSSPSPPLPHLLSPALYLCFYPLSSLLSPLSFVHSSGLFFFLTFFLSIIYLFLAWAVSGEEVGRYTVSPHSRIWRIGLADDDMENGFGVEKEKGKEKEYKIKEEKKVKRKGKGRFHPVGEIGDAVGPTHYPTHLKPLVLPPFSPPLPSSSISSSLPSYHHYCFPASHIVVHVFRAK